MNTVRYKKNIALLQDIKEDDTSFDCAIWKDTVRDEIPKILIGGLYVDVRKVVMCIYAPLDVVTDHMSKKMKVTPNEKDGTTEEATKSTYEHPSMDALLQLASHSRLVPQCENKCCLNWRHYIK